MSGILVQLPLALSAFTSLPLPQISTISASFAIASHITFFCRSERDLLYKPLFFGSFLTPAALQSLFYFYLELSFEKSLILTGTICGSSLIGLFASILIYRIWFHPLRHIPGPFWAKTTKFWLVWVQLTTNYGLHNVLSELHKKYGDIVRIGPNDISINHPDALHTLGKSLKGAYYNFAHGEHSLQTTRSKKTHAIRRRVWERAFTVKAIQDYLPRVVKYSDLLISHITKTAGTPIDITDWFSFYTFDVMGDLAFGKSFSLLETAGKDSFIIAQMHEAMKGLHAFAHVGYLLPILQMIGAGGAFTRFLEFCGRLFDDRRKITPKMKDVCSYLLEAEPENKGEHKLDLSGESRLVVVAGSDTTSTTLTTLFSLLGSNPQQLRKLQAEIDTIYDSYPEAGEGVIPPEIVKGGTTATEYLDGVIKEALRMNPPVPDGPQRTVPDEGMSLNGTWIPGRVHASYHIKSAHMDERWYPEATKFRPERWYETDEETLNKQRAAFAPFWVGTYGCVGKPFADMQLRVVVARLVRKFDVELPEGSNAEQVIASALDTFTITMGSAKAIFKVRDI